MNTRVGGMCKPVSLFTNEGMMRKTSENDGCVAPAEALVQVNIEITSGEASGEIANVREEVISTELRGEKLLALDLATYIYDSCLRIAQSMGQAFLTDYNRSNFGTLRN